MTEACVDHPQRLFLHQVFDGHGGATAAEFARDNLLQAVVEHPGFPTDLATCLVRMLVVHCDDDAAHKRAHALQPPNSSA